MRKNPNFEMIHVDYSEPILTITFNRPEKANAMNEQMTDEIEEVLDYLKVNPQWKFVVFAGEGDYFSAGADLVEASEAMKSSSDIRVVMRNDQLARQSFLRKIDELEQVTIAAIDGPMIGAAFALATACDFRIMSDHASACLPEVERGMFYTSGCTGRLVKLIGPSKAKELVMLGDTINAEESLNIGLVNKVVPTNRLSEEVDTMIAKMNQQAFLPIKMTKTIVNAATPPDNTLMHELELFELILERNDITTSMTSFTKGN